MGLVEGHDLLRSVHAVVKEYRQAIEEGTQTNLSRTQVQKAPHPQLGQDQVLCHMVCGIQMVHIMGNDDFQDKNSLMISTIFSALWPSPKGR